MLLFIGDPAVERIQEALFQYILCYCLSDGARGVKLFIQISIHLMLLFIPFPSPKPFFRYTFQYISCYCLSSRRTRSWIIQYFNTSHVTVYLLQIHRINRIKTNFNTSHVTVYRKRDKILPSICPISIHLMLLFIGSLIERIIEWMEFQYISCYCLSTWSSEFATISTISIHLMLLLIYNIIANEGMSREFQYISCYCLPRR